ncbi:NLI interacting factor-like phosphatase [Flagelloscypha sp. PMI_526]|nr:NLI interacting factor-like phosphatase [Flagelloscypha sp. PMI_526]
MNSLTYISRVARARSASQSSDEEGEKDVLIRTQPPRRSYSSPAIHITAAAERPPAVKEPQIMLEVVAPRRSLIGRVLVLAWKMLCAAWTSLSKARLLTQTPFYEYPNRDHVTPSGLEKASDEEARLTIGPRSPSHPPIPSRAHTDTSVPTTPTSSQPLPQPPPLPSSSRTPTPTLSARKSPFHLPKTLVLDLDETLIHSTSRPIQSDRTGWFGFRRRDNKPGYTVEVVLGGRTTLYHVYKRPFADFFLRTVSSWYTLVIFTASMQEYADPVIDWLDGGKGILSRRHFRDSCTQLPNGSYTKDLSIVEGDLSRVCLVDNSPISYKVNEANGIPIEGWTHDPSDEALLDLLPVLDSLRFTSDVRRVLGLRCAGQQITIS